MKDPRISDFLYYSFLVFFFLFSFYNFSEQFYPLLHSGMAITILMTPGFSIPGDLYFWGQDFGGSLIPFLSQVLCGAYKFPPVLAVSIVHYGILIAGFFALASLFKSRFLKLILALIWFFPSWHFIDHLLWFFGIQLSLLLIGIFFLNLHKKERSIPLRITWISLALVSFILSLWVSDLSLISLLLFVIPFIWKFIALIKEKKFLSTIKNREYLLQYVTVIFWLLSGLLFLYYAKSRAATMEAYHQHPVNNPSEILISLKIILLSVFKILTFASGNFIESIYSWCLVAGIPLLIINSTRSGRFIHFIKEHTWISFFILNGLITMIVLILSHWVLLNGVDRKYFSIVYMSFWIAFLLYLDNTAAVRPRLQRFLLIAITVFGFISSIYQFYIPRILPSKVNVISELNALGDMGVIASADNAYLVTISSPNHIKATPHEGEFLRNFDLVRDVFAQPKLYMIRNGWLKEFPDTLQQFGRTYEKKGKAFTKAGFELCRYERIIKKMTFGISDFKYQGIVEDDEITLSGKSVTINREYDRKKHFVYGPFILLNKGKYIIRYHLKAASDLSTNPIAMLDVSANYGKTILASRYIRHSDFGRSHHWEVFEVPVDLKKDYEGVEFRVFFMGQSELSFDHIELIEQ